MPKTYESICGKFIALFIFVGREIHFVISQKDTLRRGYLSNDIDLNSR